MTLRISRALSCLPRWSQYISGRESDQVLPEFARSNGSLLKTLAKKPARGTVSGSEAVVWTWPPPHLSANSPQAAATQHTMYRAPTHSEPGGGRITGAQGQVRSAVAGLGGRVAPRCSPPVLSG